MEKIYGCGDLEYTSEPVCLQDFLTEAISQHHPFVNGPDVTLKDCEGKAKEELFQEKMMEMMAISLTDSELLNLEQICCAENLKIESAQPPMDVSSIKKRTSFYTRAPLPNDSQLQTLKHLTSRGRIHERFLRHAGSIWLDKINTMNACTAASKSQKELDLIPGNELLAVVRLYLPFKHEIGVRNHKVAAGCQEVVVLGMQTLADLRDHFSCSSDHSICQDLSNNPSCKNSRLAKDKYKSGLMYIENVFYNDTRFPSNINYSDVILRWASERNLNLGKTDIMENTKISDLTVRLGYPYLYQHQGNCEHLFCFSDIRLLHQSDPLQLSKYPMLRCISQQQSRYCMLCGQYVAKWITVGNSRVPHDPCYFCQQCFMSYNYIKKKKIGDFAAYPIFESSTKFTTN